MNLKIDSKIYDIEMYISPWKRFKGFMFSKTIDKVICFPKCNSIHTFFMKCSIGVIYLDKDLNIIKIISNLKKNNISFFKKAYYVIECNISLLKGKQSIKIIRD